MLWDMVMEPWPNFDPLITSRIGYTLAADFTCCAVEFSSSLLQ